MKLWIASRVVMGVLFICSGSIKITRIGQAVVPDTHKQMAKDFGKFLRVAPFKSYFKCTSTQYMHFVGYLELLCGFLLLTSNITRIASLALAIVMVFAAYTHYRLKDPTSVIACPAILLVILLLVAIGPPRSKKDKEESPHSKKDKEE